MKRIEDIYSLTPAQEGIFIHYKLAPETDDYLQDYLFRVEDGTNLEALQKAIKTLPLRHSVLKTAFAAAGGAVKQVLLSDRVPEVKTVRIDAPFSEDELQAQLQPEYARTFDLQKDPLARFVFFLFRDARLLLYRTHHLIIDGWSLPVLFSDLVRDYRFLANGGSVDELKELIAEESRTVPAFSSCVNLIRAFEPAPARQYWRQLLSGAAFCALNKKTTPTPGTKEIIIETGFLPAELRDKTDAFAAAHDLSVSTLFETVFALTLRKYSGQDDVIFNKVISGRSTALPGIDRVVGPLMNTIPIRMRRDKDATPLSLLKRTGAQSIASDENGYISLSDAYRAADLDPNESGILFVFGNYDITAAEMEDPPIRLLFEQEQTEFPLTVNLSPERDEYKLQFSYDRTVYSEGQISDLRAGFLAILKALINFSDQQLNDRVCVQELLALTDREKETILGKAADGAPGFFGGFSTGKLVLIPEKSVYALFAERAAAEPDAPAIREGARRFSFLELQRAAERTDRFIRSRDHSKNQVIGVLCDRSFQELAAIFGIVRGGNAYLPISPELPPDRIALLLESANCDLVLAQEPYLRLTNKAVSIHSVLSAQSPENVPPCAALPDDPLYVIYTSGSTGVPKGAVVSNRSAVNRIGWMSREYFRTDSVVMRKTPYTFDVSVWEIFGFALFGFSLSILPAGDHYRFDRISDLIRTDGVTDIHFVPSVFSEFVTFLKNAPERRGDLTTLRNVFLSGETPHAAVVNEFTALAPDGIQLHNLYGPAECAVDVTYYDCDHALTDPIPIGKPIDNTRIYILSDAGAPVPIGVTGQICIAGANVGLGYLNDPALTEKKFVDDPFGEGKAYQTGDLGFWREDGNIVFVGRADFQFKFNGQRIEPGEIEAAMSSVAGVSEAAVLLSAEQNRIVSFYTGTAQEADLRAALQKTLPSYMIPSVIIRLQKMPLNTNGKTDRSALKKLPLPEQRNAFVYTPPATETEKAVCAAFSAILGMEKVGRNDDFYRLGGTSLQMIRLLSAEPLNKLSAADFMQAPTPAELAKKLDNEQEEKYTCLVPLYTRSGARRAVILIPFAGGDAGAYAALVHRARQDNRDLSLYYADWDHFNDPAPLADEIRALAQKKTVLFYSHCAGSAFALKLLDQLNAETRTVQAYLAAADIPPRRGASAFNAWNFLADPVILRKLRKAGLKTDDIPEETLHAILKRFRDQTTLYNAYFSEKTQKTNVLTTVIISRNDPFTVDFKSAAKRWGDAVTEIKRVILLDVPSHYFQQTESELLLSLFFESSEG